MKTEEQYTSPELSEHLKRLMVPQDGFTYWLSNLNSNARYLGFKGSFDKVYHEQDAARALSVPELMEMLPAFIDIGHEEPFNNFYLRIEKRMTENIRYIAIYVCDTMPGEQIGNPAYEVRSQLKTYGENLANCLAQLLIDLIKNGYVKYG